jgi:plasmid stabilization system protein ParE
MSLPVVLRPEARREFDESYDWYEKDRPGRGDRFAAAVRKVLDQVEQFRDSHPIFHWDIRRAVVPHFPYLVYYRVRPDHVAVIAVVHGKRDQGYWRSRN